MSGGASVLAAGLAHWAACWLTWSRTVLTASSDNKTVRGRGEPDRLQVVYSEDFFSSLKTGWFVVSRPIMCVREHQKVLPFPTRHAWLMEVYQWNVQLIFLFLFFYHRTPTFIEKAPVYVPFCRSRVPHFPMSLPYVQRDADKGRSAG